MALCLCETRYGLFRTVKTFKWREIIDLQGSPWTDVLNQWSQWANEWLNRYATSPYTFDYSTTEKVECTPLQPQFSKITNDTCRWYNMSKVDEKDIDFGIEPEPKNTEPKNEPTPPDDYGTELGPFYQGQDPPGEMWDKSPPSWQPTQMIPKCTCVNTEGGDVLGVENDRINTDQYPWIPVQGGRTHSEDVEVKFWTSWKRQEKIGYERSCCEGYGVGNAGRDIYENGWNFVSADPNYPGSEAGKYYKEDTMTVSVLYGLHYKTYTELIKMRKRHACL